MRGRSISVQLLNVLIITQVPAVLQAHELMGPSQAHAFNARLPYKGAAKEFQH